uniref:Uncharacterized protein n=1 Tax=Oryza brachyantha TaxID=4533 RepID=J3M129_ORYBR
MAQFFGRMWDRAQGPFGPFRVTRVAYRQAVRADDLRQGVQGAGRQEQAAPGHQLPPCRHPHGLQSFKKNKIEGITLEEFRGLIMEWVRKDLRLVLANKAAVAIMAAPLLAVTAKKAGKPDIRAGKQ